MLAGKLDRRITISRATETRDAVNAIVQTWADLVTVWASKRDVSDGERFQSGTRNASKMTRFQIRWSPTVADVNAKDRVVFEGITYDIQNAKELGRREGIEITASARTDSDADQLQLLGIPTVVPYAGVTTPATIVGTWDEANAQTLAVTFNSVTYVHGANSELVSDGYGNWTLTLPGTLTPGTYSATVETTASGGRIAIDATNNEIVIEASPLLPVGSRLIGYGDSNIEYGMKTTANTLSNRSAGDLTWAHAIFPAFQHVAKPNGADPYGRGFTGMNLGDAGDTAANCSGGARMAELLSYNPSAVFVRVGTNDIAAGNSAATVQASIQTLINTLLGAGIKVVLSTIPPTGMWNTPTNLTDPRYAVRSAVNAWINGLVAAGLTICDINPYVEDFTSRGGAGGLWKASNYWVTSADSNHFGAQGAYEASKALVPALQSIIDAGSVITPDVGNLFINSGLLGTAGARNPTTAGLITGPAGGATQIADSWRVSRSSGTNSAAVETSKEVIDGSHEKQVVTFKPGGSSLYENYVFEAFSAGSNNIALDASLAVNDWIKFACRLEVPDWGNQWSGYQLTLSLYDASNVLIRIVTGLETLDLTNRTYPSGALDIWPETLPIQIAANAAKYRAQVVLYPRMNGAPSNGIIKISQPWLGKVPAPETFWS